jgi:hypothetical protein
MQRYTVYLCLETALNVSGGTSTYHQEHIQLYLQHLVLVTPLLLPAAIVEEKKKKKRRNMFKLKISRFLYYSLMMLYKVKSVQYQQNISPCSLAELLVWQNC